MSRACGATAVQLSPSEARVWLWPKCRRPADASSGAPQDEMLVLFGIDEGGRIEMQVTFDIEDKTLTRSPNWTPQHARLEPAPPPRAPLENTASLVNDRLNTLFTGKRWQEIGGTIRQQHPPRGPAARTAQRKHRPRRRCRGSARDRRHWYYEIDSESHCDTRGTPRTRSNPPSREGYAARRIPYRNTHDLRDHCGRGDYESIAFDLENIEAAITELDARYAVSEAAPHCAHMAGHHARPTPEDSRRTATVYTGSGEHRPSARDPYGTRRRDRLLPRVLGPCKGLQALRRNCASAHRSRRGFYAVGRGNLNAGFEAAWRAIDLVTVDGDRICRGENFRRSRPRRCTRKVRRTHPSQAP